MTAAELHAEARSLRERAKGLEDEANRMKMRGDLALLRLTHSELTEVWQRAVDRGVVRVRESHIVNHRFDQLMRAVGNALDDMAVQIADLERRSRS